jgi:glycosyltransferase involved in cell wall biosynthesis
MKSPLPQVSVVIPAYNAAPVLPEAIASVQDQTFTDWELIIVDDGSRDGTADIAHQLAETDNRIRVIHQNNQGVSVARNIGVSQSCGSIIAFLDADDLWVPTKLATHLAAFASNPHLGVSFARVEFLTQTGLSMGQISSGRLTGLKLEHLLCENPTTTTSNWVIRREVWTQVGELCPTMSYSEDLEWLLRALCTQQWQIEGIPQVLTRYRTSTGGLSSALYRMEAGWQTLIEQAKTYAPELVQQHFHRAQAIHLRYLARRAFRLRLPAPVGIDFITRALRSDWQLVLREPRRTLATLAAVYGAYLQQQWHAFRTLAPPTAHDS